MAAFLAILAAASWGAGDFLGGLASRQVAALRVVVVSQVVGLVLVIGLVPFFSTDVGLGDVGWGALGGLAGSVGLLLLYRGLAAGAMSIVAPVTAVGAAILPVAYGLVIGERPGAAVLTGSVIALLAIWLVSSGSDEDTGAETADPSTGLLARLRSRGLIQAIGAGIGFGAFFIFLQNTASDSGMVPLVSARIASVSLMSSLGLATGVRLSVPRQTVLPVVTTGVLDIAANVLFLVAVRTGLISVVAVLASLYPAGTVALAAIVVRERVTRQQVVGLGLALVGMAMIAAG